MNNGRDCEHGRQLGKFYVCDLVEAENRIAELENLAQMIIDGESADPRVLLLMYKVWLNKAKALKEQGE